MPGRFTGSPYLSISAEFLDFSTDGEWIAYVEDGEIYRSRKDGQERLHLTSDFSGTVYRVWWSPDGSQILFRARVLNSGSRLYLVSRDAGPVQELLQRELDEEFTHLEGAPSSPFGDATWSPDGNQIAYSYAVVNRKTDSHILDFHVLDLATREVEKLPYLERKFPGSVHWSPKGRYLATEADRGVFLFCRARLDSFGSEREPARMVSRWELFVCSHVTCARRGVSGTDRIIENPGAQRRVRENRYCYLA